jgi:hypothetical protein
VEASGEGVGAVADDPAVAAVVAALRLADHPGDAVAAFHVASCPLGAVVGLRSREPSGAADASRRLRRAFVERGARELLAQWKRALRGVSTRRSLVRLEQAVDLAERFEREGGGRPADLAAFLTRSLVESPRQSGVRVMTIHRAKGLEFDTVVLPALERPLLRGVESPVYLVRRSPLSPVESVHRTAPASVRRLAPELEEGFEQERARRLRDDLSALYVGLTRARHTLHLWVEPPAARAGGGGARPPLSFAAILRATLGRGAVADGVVTSRSAPAVPPAEPAPSPRGLVAADPAAPSAGRALYRAGSLDPAAKAVADAAARQRRAVQGVLPLASSPRTALPRALRPVIRLEELRALTPLPASVLLAEPASPRDRGAEPWRAIEAQLAGTTTGLSPPAVLSARAWLLAEGRALGRPERDRRFLGVVGDTTVTGALRRVWLAGSAGAPTRALVGLDDELLRSAVAVETSAAHPGPAPATIAELHRRAAARALALHPSQVGVLLGGTSPIFLPPLRGGPEETP